MTTKLPRTCKTCGATAQTEAELAELFHSNAPGYFRGECKKCYVARVSRDPNNGKWRKSDAGKRHRREYMREYMKKRRQSIDKG